MVPPEEAERGLLILPEKQFMAMLDTPVSSRIIFNQFLASLSGSVTCIGTLCVHILLLSYCGPLLRELSPIEYSFKENSERKTRTYCAGELIYTNPD